MKNEERRTKIFLIIIIVCIGLLIWAEITDDKHQSIIRFLFCMAYSVLGISIRLVFHPILFNDKSEENSDLKSNLFYFFSLFIISCFVYLGFYDVINKMDKLHFHILSFLLFISMGLTVRTVIRKYGPSDK